MPIANQSCRLLLTLDLINLCLYNLFYCQIVKFMIQVQNLHKSFGPIKAVDGLSFTVKEGEIVGLLGPNGAGKTTTMRMMTGFLSPDVGTAEIEGISVLENPIQAQRVIGYLPENNPLYKEMLVAELLKFSAELKNLPQEQIKKAIDFAVSSVSIKDVFYRPIVELSKGYKQRVGIALTLLHQPKILIMDEPSEGLDPNQRSEIRHLIKNLSKNHTIIVSTHVMQEVEAVCNRLIIINKGKLVADGSPKDLTRQAIPGQQLYLEVEGKLVESHLKKIAGVEKVEIQKERDNRIMVIITVAKRAKIQPEISRLSAKLGWTIWKLNEEEKGLEEVFHLLTQESTL